MGIDKRRIYHIDWYLIINGFAIFLIGLVNLISATSSFYSSSYNFLIKQIVAFLIGIGLIVLILHYDYKTIVQNAKWFYMIGLILIIIVLIVGLVAGGARRWINILGINIQPSEFMKPILILYLANILHEKKRQNLPLTLKEVLFPLGVVVFPTVLIIKQPDLGTGVIIVLTSLCILWFVGLKKSTYAVLGIIGVASPFLAWHFVMRPYQKMRILSFINIDADPSGFGYHAKQAMIAVGSGKFFGKGFMQGTQHKLQFIPEHHTDFIFTVFGEEWGFLGSVILFMLFASFIWRCIKIAQTANDEMGSIVSFGVASMIFLQFLINVMMAIHLAPVVGIPLPFISYGGSSLLSVLASVGLLLNINMRRYMF